MELLLMVKTFFTRHLTPQRTFILSFAAVIMAGAFLVWLPFSAGKGSIRFIDALFTSASAVCITGLAVLDIGGDLSLAGQIVLLFLFQIGGLGIITFSVVIFGLMGRGISFRGREICQSTFLCTPRRDFFTIMKWALLLTLVCEAAGTVLLFLRFSWDFPPARAFYLALFHAVSAFNNCGYSLFSDSLTGYRGDVLVNLTVMGLIVIGGIGFIVQYELIRRLRGAQKRLSVHARIVMLTTASLIVIGAAAIYLFERENTLKDVPLLTRTLAAFFQSVTARTAGFSTLETSQLSNGTILLMIVFMFIGASPGSTGGGIKTTSFALLLLIIWNRMRGSEKVNVFNRTIPEEILGRTIAITLASAILVGIVASLLLFLEGDGLQPAASRHLFVEYLYETVSAFGTVGLSMGVTAKMSDAQKLAVIVMMFAGRVGPLTLAYSMYMSGKREIRYAEESVMVG